MYVGGGQMIHSPHTGSVASVVSVYWDSFVGAARPG
jgi:cell wall-associated NlpC family hydrolase